MATTPDLTSLFTTVSADLRQVVQGEIDLAKAEVRQLGSRFSKAGAGFAIVLVGALSAAIIALFLVAAGFAWLYATVTTWSPWAVVFLGLLSAFVLFLIITAIAAAAAIHQMKAGRAESQDITQRLRLSAGQSVAALQEGLAGGQAKAKTPARLADGIPGSAIGEWPFEEGDE